MPQNLLPGGSSFKSEASPERGDAARTPRGRWRLEFPNLKLLVQADKALLWISSVQNTSRPLLVDDKSEIIYVYDYINIYIYIIYIIYIYIIYNIYIIYIYIYIFMGIHPIQLAFLRVVYWGWDSGTCRLTTSMMGWRKSGGSQEA